MPGSISTRYVVCYSRQARRDRNHHASVNRQAHDHQRNIQHNRTWRNTSTFIFFSSTRLSRTLERYTSGRCGSWRSGNRSDRKAACMRVLASLHTAWHAHAQVSCPPSFASPAHGTSGSAFRSAALISWYTSSTFQYTAKLALGLRCPYLVQVVYR